MERVLVCTARGLTKGIRHPDRQDGCFQSRAQRNRQEPTGPQGGQPTRARLVYCRYFPDPLGIVLWLDKLFYSCLGKHVIASQ